MAPLRAGIISAAGKRRKWLDRLVTSRHAAEWTGVGDLETVHRAPSAFVNNPRQPNNSNYSRTIALDRSSLLFSIHDRINSLRFFFFSSFYSFPPFRSSELLLNGLWRNNGWIKSRIPVTRENGEFASSSQRCSDFRREEGEESSPLLGRVTGQ